MKKLSTILFSLLLFLNTVMGQNIPNELVVFDYMYGEVDDVFAWADTGGKSAVKFHPQLPWLGYPLRVVGGAVYIFPDYPPGQIIGSSFRIEVYDDDGVDGYPNSLLGSVDCIVDSTGWYEFYGLDVTIEEGMFYIAMVQTDFIPNCAGIAIDYQSAYYGEMSYLQVPDSTFWQFGIYQNFMIKAYVDTEVGYREIINKSAQIISYPNPFTTSTTIEYELYTICNIQYTVYNMMGEMVFYSQENMLPPGRHTITWSPGHLPAGLYYGVLRSEEGVSVVKMVKQ
jgi:hypothetical protein